MNADMTHMTADLDESLPAKVIDDVPPAKSSNVIGSETQVNKGRINWIIPTMA